jgi:hypothetical protein
VAIGAIHGIVNFALFIRAFIATIPKDSCNDTSKNREYYFFQISQDVVSYDL